MAHSSSQNSQTYQTNFLVFKLPLLLFCAALLFLPRILSKDGLVATYQAFGQFGFVIPTLFSTALPHRHFYSLILVSPSKQVYEIYFLFRFLLPSVLELMHVNDADALDHDVVHDVAVDALTMLPITSSESKSDPFPKFDAIID